MLGSAARRWQAGRRRPKLLTGALIAALCAPVLDPQVQLFWRDTRRFFHPFKLAMAERLRAGELPPWEGWTESGVSVLSAFAATLALLSVRRYRSAAAR
jgi:hypothetical protein